jgi:ABC-type sugar transport system ATPase subunit
VDERREIAETVRTMQELRTRAASPFVAAGTLSGGNQQKVVLAKWLLTGPKVLFLDEPTRGIDVGARQEFYKLIAELAAKGMAIVLVSSELEEVIGLADRVLVMHRGRIAGEFSRDQVTPEQIMACAIGQAQELAS